MFENFLKYWNAYMREAPDQRVGQSLYNAAFTFDSKTAKVCDQVLGTQFDPFHNDTNCIGFLERIQEALS